MPTANSCPRASATWNTLVLASASVTWCRVQPSRAGSDISGLIDGAKEDPMGAGSDGEASGSADALWVG